MRVREYWGRRRKMRERYETVRERERGWLGRVKVMKGMGRVNEECRWEKGKRGSERS